MRLVHGEDRERVTVTYPQNNGNNPQPYEARGKPIVMAECTLDEEDGGSESKENVQGCSAENENHSVSLRW